VQLSEAEWAAFERTHAADAGTLRADQRVRLPQAGFVGIKLSASDALLGKLTPQAVRVLLAHHFDPVEMIAQALYDEVKSGNLEREADQTRLVRAAGGCNFCDNKDWRFDEGCTYPSAHTASVSDSVVKELAERLDRPLPSGSPPDAVRVWLGRRRSDLPVDKFADKLRDMFVPATVQMLQPLGLTAYLPTLLPGADTSLPDEIALVFYESQQAYNDARNTPTGRAYAELHGTAFDSKSSSSSFPQLFHGTLQDNTAYHLFVEPAQWQVGSTYVCIAKLERPAAGQTLQDMSANFLATLRAKAPQGLDGYIALLRGDLWFRWAHFSGAEPVDNAALDPSTKYILHQSRSRPHKLNDGTSYTLTSRVPLDPNTTLSLQFRPR
jgi:hypothetical protein